MYQIGTGQLRFITQHIPSASSANAKKCYRSGLRYESLNDKILPYCGVILIVSMPLLLASIVLLLMSRSSIDTVTTMRKTVPGGSAEGEKKYAVIFDEGSSESRVQVYCLDKNLELLHIGKEIELYVQKRAREKIEKEEVERKKREREQKEIKGTVSGF